MITGFARLDGWPVALLASDPYYYAGAWTADACRKAVRLVDLAQTFRLPVVHLVDIPGFLIGKQAEASGIMRFGTQALAAIRQSTVPCCAVIVRKAFGMAGLAQRNGSAAFMRYAWPSARSGSLPIAGGVDAAYRAVIEAAPDPAAKRAEIEAKLEALQSPLRTAEAFGIEEIIDPRRPALICAASPTSPRPFGSPAARTSATGPKRVARRSAQFQPRGNGGIGGAVDVLHGRPQPGRGRRIGAWPAARPRSRSGRSPPAVPACRRPPAPSPGGPAGWRGAAAGYRGERGPGPTVGARPSSATAAFHASSVA